MRKRGKKLLAMTLAVSMSMNMISFQALADEISDGSPTVTEGTVDVETQKGKEEAVDVWISVSPNADGTIETKTVARDGVDVTEGGSLVKLEGTELTDPDGQVIESKMEYDVQKGSYNAKGGSETTLEEKAPEVTVDVPLTDKDDPNTANTENKNTATDEDEVGDSNTLENSESSKTTETVVGQGSVTIETTDITITEKINSEDIEMEYVRSETNPDGDNDLVHVGAAAEEFLPGYEGTPVIPEGVDGYECVYVGSGNTSKYFPAIVFKEPLSDEDKIAQFGDNAYIKDNSITWYYVKWLKEEDKARIAKDPNGKYITDEEGYILDIEGKRILKEERTETGPNGETTYLHRFDNYNDSLKAEGWYKDGKWVEELNGTGYYGIWAGPQQFVLVDSKGNIITTYCADFTTPTQDAYGYNIENLEDATYYDDASAKQIRSIALHGYWGTKSEGENPIPEFGSLDAMKADLMAAGFSEEELKSLNDGVALTATQMAIWSCSNKMSGLEYFNAHYSDWGVGNVPEEKEDEVKLLFKIYDYLINLDPTEVEDKTTDKVINADNFLKDMSVTVIEKAEDHTNNQDDDDTNDAYVTDLTFALVVTPSTENGDDLVVKVLDGKGKEIASARIAGEAKDGETILTADENGNYTFANIVLTEGTQNFNITMEGIQNLKEGVYLYTSEVRTDDGRETSSQTLVGVASGQHSVNVSMNIEFDLSVEDEIVAKEHVWRTEWYDRDDDDGGNGGNGGGSGSTVVIEDPNVPLAAAETIEISENDVPLSDGAVLNIEDSMIPLAVLPMTGDVSVIWMLLSLISGIGLAGVSLADRRKRR